MNKWISVKERLPETGDYSVLGYFTTGSIENIHVEDWFGNIENGFDKLGNQKYTKWYLCAKPTITHWMPLPVPPITNDQKEG